LVNRVRYITKSTTGETANDAVVEFLKEGVQFLIHGVPKELFSGRTTSTTISNGQGYDIDKDIAMQLIRNGVECREVPPDMAYAYSTMVSTTPLFRATKIFPVFYQQGNKLYIKPNPTTAEVGTINKLSGSPAITSTDISWLYDGYDLPAVTFAASRDFGALSKFYSLKASSQINTILTEVSSKIASFAAFLPSFSVPSLPLSPTNLSISLTYTAPSGYSLPSTIFTVATTLPVLTNHASSMTFTEFDDAVAKAKSLIDNATALSAGQDAEYYLNLEDTEMMREIFQTAAQEINRASAEVQKQRALLDQFARNVEQELQSGNTKLNRYQNEVQKSVQEMNEYLQSYEVEQRDSDATLRSDIAELEQKIQDWNQKAQNLVSRFRAETELETNEFNANLSKARSYLEAAQVVLGRMAGVSQYNAIAEGCQADSLRLFRQAQDELRNLVQKNLAIPSQE
jgi:hypothetical protein